MLDKIYVAFRRESQYSCAAPIYAGYNKTLAESLLKTGFSVYVFENGQFVEELVNQNEDKIK